MKKKSQLWVFGSSLCLPFNLKKSALSWPDILADKLSYECINLAEPGADNFFIYQAYLYHKKHIKSNDLLIILWSHYSRKSFLLDPSNSQQKEVLKNSLIYQTGDQKFIRNHNPINHNIQSWLTMNPKKTNLFYYNSWFENYYSAYEQKCNLQSYIDSVELGKPCGYVSSYFSKESVQDVDITRSINGGYMVDFIFDNNLVISDTDAHLNESGHNLWAQKLYELINQNNLTTT